MISLLSNQLYLEVMHFTANGLVHLFGMLCIMFDIQKAFKTICKHRSCTAPMETFLDGIVCYVIKLVSIIVSVPVYICDFYRYYSVCLCERSVTTQISVTDGTNMAASVMILQAPSGSQSDCLKSWKSWKTE